MVTRERLLRLEHARGSGRISLALVYVGRDSGVWQFSESVDYLKQFGIPPGGMNYCMHRRVQTCDFLAPQSADRAFEPRCEQRLALV